MLPNLHGCLLSGVLPLACVGILDLPAVSRGPSPLPEPAPAGDIVTGELSCCTFAPSVSLPCRVRSARFKDVEVTAQGRLLHLLLPLCMCAAAVQLRQKIQTPAEHPTPELETLTVNEINYSGLSFCLCFSDSFSAPAPAPEASSPPKTEPEPVIDLLGKVSQTKHLSLIQPVPL